MELYQLEYFRALCKYGSYTQTAQKLGISQPAVSSAVKKLEAELNVRLAEKTGKGFVLTPAGRAILEHAESIHDQVSNLYHTAAEYEEGASDGREVITLAFPLTICANLTRSIYDDFAPAHPELQVDLLKMGPEYVVENLDNESVDLGVSCYDCKLPTLDCQLLFKTEFGVFFSPEHEFNQYDCITPEMLADQKVLMGSGQRGLGRPIQNYFRQHGIHPPLTDIGAILPTEKLDIVRKGTSVAILSLNLNSANRARLFPPLYVEWASMWRKGRKLTANQEKLLRFIKDFFS